MQPIQIRYLRQSLGLSQTDFARWCGVTQTTVSHWENGRFPPTKMAHILLGYIGTHHHIDIPLEDEIEEVEQ